MKSCLCDNVSWRPSSKLAAGQRAFQSSGQNRSELDNVRNHVGHSISGEESLASSFLRSFVMFKYVVFKSEPKERSLFNISANSVFSLFRDKPVEAWPTASLSSEFVGTGYLPAIQATLDAALRVRARHLAKSHGSEVENRPDFSRQQ